MTHKEAHKYFMKIANDLGTARKVLVKLRHTLRFVQSLEDSAPFATLQLHTRNMADDILALAEELNLLQNDATVKGIACKRHVEPIHTGAVANLKYSEATYTQREMMRNGTEFPLTREYSVDEITPPVQPAPRDRTPL